jgi:hypothetical protein
VVPISASGTKADDHWFMRNGIPLSEIYHAAFDAHLIGHRSDCRLHVSERLLMQNESPMLVGLERLNGGTIHPRNATRTCETATGSRCVSSGSRQWLETSISSHRWDRLFRGGASNCDPSIDFARRHRLVYQGKGLTQAGLDAARRTAPTRL